MKYNFQIRFILTVKAQRMKKPAIQKTLFDSETLASECHNGKLETSAVINNQDEFSYRLQSL